MDPFDTLGIEPRYNLDLKSIEKRHRELSRTLHPDRYVGRPSSERRMAYSRALEVNDAWRVVRDPVRRAEALLTRAGVAVGEASKQQAQPQLLMQMMEAREALAEARAENDHVKISALSQQMQQRHEELVALLSHRLDELPAPSPSSLQQACTVLGELRFVRRFLEEASAAEEELP